jgi:hypothetical protein
MKGGFLNKAGKSHVLLDGGNLSSCSSDVASPYPIVEELETVEPPTPGKMRSEKFHESCSKNFWEDFQSVHHNPTAGDILVTLDANNFAELSLWDESVVPRKLLSSKRGAWLIAVVDVRVLLTGGQLLPPGWQDRCRCLMTFKLSATGLWSADEHPKPLFFFIPQEGGLGCSGILVPFF